MNTSALNAEELRRENGILALEAAFARCVDVLSASSKQDDMAVQVHTYIYPTHTISLSFSVPRCVCTSVDVLEYVLSLKHVV